MWERTWTLGGGNVSYASGQTKGQNPLREEWERQKLKQTIKKTDLEINRLTGKGINNCSKGSNDAKL